MGESLAKKRSNMGEVLDVGVSKHKKISYTM